MKKLETGFTLIEVLIALSMLSIMMGLLFSSMQTSVVSWHTAENKLDIINKKSVFYQFFKQHLVNAKPLYAINDNSQSQLNDIKKMVFQGDSTRIKFVSTLPAASLRKGEQIFNVGVSLNNPDKITVALIPYREQQNSADESILIDHVKQLEFSYFGKMNENFDRIWVAEWNDIEELPRLVRIKVVLDDNSIWPEMVFPLKISSWHTSSLNQQDYKSFTDGNYKKKQ